MKRNKRPEGLSGEDYARDLHRDGLSYDHVRSGADLGTGYSSQLLRATWGENPDKTLDREATEKLDSPHVFVKKWKHKRRGKRPHALSGTTRSPKKK